MATKTVKASLKVRIQSAIAGINQHLSSSTTVMLGGTAKAPSAMVQLLQSCLDAIAATATAEAQWHAAVLAEKQLAVQAQALLLAIKTYALNEYGRGSPVLSDFGIVLTARQPPTVKVKALAVDRNLGTRKERGTMGPRQRAKAETSTALATVPGTPTPTPTKA
jgi:hypothetical protein